MNKRRLRIGSVASAPTKRLRYLLAVLILFTTGISAHLSSAQTPTPVRNPDNQPILAACSDSSVLFPGSDAKGVGGFTTWKRLYENRVRDVTETHLTQSTIVCSELAKEPPSPSLRDLASRLPPWQKPERLAQLSEDDMGSVLLEYLRVYECSMRNDTYFFQEAADLRKADTTGLHWAQIGDFSQKYLAEVQLMNREMKLAPKTLERTLKMLSGFDRLRPIDHSLECLSRTSLDIRNALGLAAETSACLPRIWDTRGSLRDITQ